MDQNHPQSNWQTTLTGNCPYKRGEGFTSYRSPLHLGDDFNSLFVWDFPTLCQGLRYLFIYLSICVREQSISHVVSDSTREREDPGNEVECLLRLFLPM